MMSIQSSNRHPSSTYDEESGRHCPVSMGMVQARVKRKLRRLSTKNFLLLLALFSASFIVGYDDSMFDLITAFIDESRYDGFHWGGVDPHTRRLMAVKGDYENRIITAAKQNKDVKRLVKKVR